MERGSWSEVSGDKDIWKKLFLGAASVLCVLSLPLALGVLNTDLEAESARLKSKEPAGKFSDFSDLGTMFGRGLGPTFIFFLAMMAFCVPTVVVLMSAFQTYGWLKSENGINIISFTLTSMFGLAALAAQFGTAVLFPVAIAQYARGLNIKQALDPMSNFGFALELGATYWFKASGYWLFLASNLALWIIDANFFTDLIARLLFTMLGFASLIVSSRYALSHVSRL